MKAQKYFILIVLVLSGLFNSAVAQKQFKALLVTTTRGWHHESLHYGVVAIKELGVKNFLMWYYGKTPKGLLINM